MRNARGVNAGEARTDIPRLLKWLSLLSPAARAQAQVVLRTGLRAFELRRVVATMIQPLRGFDGVTSVLVLPRTATKGGHERRIALVPHLARCIHWYSQQKLLQRDYKKQFARAGKEVFNDTITLRDLRHTFASLASRHDPDATRRIMGHVTGDANVAMFYQHATDERIARVAVEIDRELGPLPALG